MQCLVGLLFILGAIVAFVLMRRDRDKIRGSGRLGNAMQNLEGLFVESKKHVIEAEREERSEEDDSGDPPEK